MKTTILAVATVLTLAAGAAQAFAADRNATQQSQGTNVFDRCASILANPEAYAPADVKYCKSVS